METLHTVLGLLAGAAILLFRAAQRSRGAADRS